MNHLKLYEEFSEEEFDSMMGDMKSLGFEGYSLYFVKMHAEEGMKDIENGKHDYEYQSSDYACSICCKTADEFYDLLSSNLVNKGFPPNTDNYETYIEEIVGLDLDDMESDDEDSVIKKMSGSMVSSFGPYSDDNEYYKAEIEEILGPYDVNVTESMIEEYPFKPGSKMAKYAAPYMNLPEVKALVASVSK